MLISQSKLGGELLPECHVAVLRSENTSDKKSIVYTLFDRGVFCGYIVTYTVNVAISQKLCQIQSLLL